MDLDTLTQYVGDRVLKQEDLANLKDEAEAFIAELDEAVDDAINSGNELQLHDAEKERADWFEECGSAYEDLVAAEQSLPNYECAYHDNDIDTVIRYQIEECYDGIRMLPSFIDINWDSTVDNCKQDWSQFTYGNIDYWYRE